MLRRVQDVFLERSSKRQIASVEIRKEQTSMEILERVLDGGNLVDAMNKVLANKGAAGIDEVTTELFKEEYVKGNINFEEIKV